MKKALTGLLLVSNLYASDNYFSGIEVASASEHEYSMTYLQMKAGKYFGNNRIYVDAGYDIENNGNYIGLGYDYMLTPYKNGIRTYIGTGISRIKTVWDDISSTTMTTIDLDDGEVPLAIVYNMPAGSEVSTKITLFEYGGLYSITDRMDLEGRINFKYGSYGGILSSANVGIMYNY